MNVSIPAVPFICKNCCMCNCNNKYGAHVVVELITNSNRITTTNHHQYYIYAYSSKACSGLVWHSISMLIQPPCWPKISIDDVGVLWSMARALGVANIARDMCQMITAPDSVISIWHDRETLVERLTMPNTCFTHVECWECSVTQIARKERYTILTQHLTAQWCHSGAKTCAIITISAPPPSSPRRCRLTLACMRTSSPHYVWDGCVFMLSLCEWARLRRRRTHEIVGAHSLNTGTHIHSFI